MDFTVNPEPQNLNHVVNSPYQAFKGDGIQHLTHQAPHISGRIAGFLRHPGAVNVLGRDFNEYSP